MLNLETILKKAQHSSFHLWLLNVGLHRMIQFNKPHGFRVIEIRDGHIKILLPYRKRNFNHIRGLHACALATLTEFSSGLLLILKLGMKKYRIILKKLTMEYHYQGKTDAIAEFSLTDEWVRENIFHTLANQESVIVTCEVKISDTNGNHLSTGITEWQLKDWSKVKTKA
jgi:acyl-coenzyme A thioesterase PaaI-like protein